MNEGHAVATEQKIRELKKQLKNFKQLNKIEKKILKPNEVFELAADQKVQSTNGGNRKKSTESEEYRLTNDFLRLKKSIKMQNDILDLI